MHKIEIAAFSVNIFTTPYIVHQVLFPIVTLLQVIYNILAYQFFIPIR
jgi:hypothetical protein